MLTVVYCRVSTEEQATEGFSIEGQAEKLKSYAELNDLGEVLVIADPGMSGKNLDRPGLQQILKMVEDGNVSHVLTWRLDRLSRNLGDLILLAERFEQAGVSLHSFTEKIDLSSATGRMFYNILGSFAQFYREQLAENVKMGTAQAVRECKWVNRPKTGYDLVDGNLVPNEMAPVVQEMFRLRALGRSQTEIAAVTGVHHSTVIGILHSRIYLGEVLHNGTWHQGVHEPIITQKQYAAAHRGRVPRRRRGRDLLSGRVRCGLCSRLMALDTNGEGREFYRCQHRGQGCDQPRRTTTGLHRAALLGLSLIGEDHALHEAIRAELDRVAQPARRAEAGQPGRASQADSLILQRRKLLKLHYQDQISAELFAEEEARLSALIEADRQHHGAVVAEQVLDSELRQRFEEVAALLATMQVRTLWAAATPVEKRVLIDEFIKEVTVLPDHLAVQVAGAPPLKVLYDEVGLKAPQSQISGVGGGT